MSTDSAPRALGANATLESLKKEAKRWLKALRDGDAAARERLRRVLPTATATIGLREVQHALALEYGVAGWIALKDVLADRELARRSAAERADEFLRQAVDAHGGAVAANILRKHADVARFSLHTAVVAGDLAEVERRLAADPSTCGAAGGPRGWQPLQYLCYARTPITAASENAVTIARVLLDAGADPNAIWKDEWNTPFKLVTGVIAEGEQFHARHPRAIELAELLIERGADPYDMQSLYNTSLHADDPFWLEFLYSRCEAAGTAERWGPKGQGWGANGMLDYLLGNAVGNNHIRRTRWLLEHGARATATHAYSKRPVHTEAVLGGFTELAELLVRHGAKPEPLNDVHAFQAACMTCDREAAQRLLAAHPELVRFPGPMYVATEGDRVDVVELLLALGVSPDVEHGHWTALHAAAHNTSVRVAELLIARGASIDIREDKYHATPLGHAVYMRREQMVEILSRVSRDVVSIVRAGRLERLREVLDAEPGLIGTTHQGRTLLFFLAAPEERAIEIAELLLARGADPAFKDADGMTAADAASKLGFDDVASLLRD